jgi:uncharacterized protein (TIGR02231 family)
MKAKISFLALFLIPILAAGQIIPVKTEIKKVKVYLSGAELYHTAKTRLEKGNSEILFENIASNFDVNSVSVTGRGNFIITSIGQQYNYLKNSVKPTEIKVLEDSLERVNNDITKKRNDRDILTYEQELIMANRNLSGKQTNVTIAEIQKYADYLKKRVGEIKKETSAVDKELVLLEKSHDRIARQLQELNNKYNQPVNQISVDVSADAAVNAEFEISYIVYSASWSPVYDVRVQDITKPIKLNYTAKVRQNSGLEWNGVKIILSSMNPFVSQTKPELNPWLIDFPRIAKKAYPQAVSNSLASRAQGVFDKAGGKAEEVAESIAESMADYTTVNEDMLSFEFESAIPYSIPSDGKPHSVNLKDYELNGTFEYYAAPKLERDAFLVAYLTKWNDFNFLPGEANTYFQNSFIGKTFLDPNISKDTLTLSLGRDKGINVERKPIKDYTEDKFLSSDIERTFAYEIITKNNKNKAVNVLVEDLIPVSKNEDIVVKLIESSGGIYNKETGRVKWNVSVGPGKSVTKKLIFSVRHPKDKHVSGL